MKRKFKEGIPHHVYCKGENGNVVFYSIEDCLFYVTLYYVLAKKHNITTYAFSLMPNHTHSMQTSLSEKSFLAFNQELNSKFTKYYNMWHQRQGPILSTPFGSAPKMVGKLIRSCFSYINNNGHAGNLSKGIMDYRWNLLAYHRSENPFSDRIVLAQASRRLRRALKMVNYHLERGDSLSYGAITNIMHLLNTNERNQITDYIISHYNPLDYNGLTMYFGSVDKAMLAMEANGGSEHDIREDWEDYSVYSELAKQMLAKGYSPARVNYETMPYDDMANLAIILLGTTKASKRQIEKYLHFKFNE